MSISIGQYLLARLSEVGVRNLFGVPGDFNLWFLEETVIDGSINFVGCCNELNAAYAADGNARLSGISALATTYGVGELAALSGVAGAYAERVPIVCITGIPPLPAMRERALLHHTLADGNYDNMLNCYREFTVPTHESSPPMLDRKSIEFFGHAGSKSDRCIFSFPPMLQVQKLNRLRHPWISIFHRVTKRNLHVPSHRYPSVFR